MSLGHGPTIVRDGLEICVDTTNLKSLAWDHDLISNSAFPRRPDFLEPVGDLQNFTLNVVLQKIGTTTGYAINPIRKINGTSAASWTLYHFGNWSDNGNDGIMRYYYTTSSGSWTASSGSYRASLNEVFEFSLQYSSLFGSQTWLNGSKIGSLAHPGGVKTNMSDLVIDTNNLVIPILYAAIYRRTLTDHEMVINYNRLKSRFGI